MTDAAIQDSLLERFLRYVRITTQADEKSSTYPSTPGQLDLSRMLRDELLALGYKDARMTEFGIVHATIPATVPGVPVVALNSHVDTSPEFSGRGVNPILHLDYQGGDIVLPNDTSRVIRVSDNPELNDLIGKTIISSDGTTLLGGDDKCGVAIIMEVAKILATNKDIPHGEVKVVFTCDEEIGKGVLHLDPKDLGADVAYTLDGHSSGIVEGETFSADKAVVTITGVNTHPSTGKGKMVNAIRIAAAFIDRLPQRKLSPESTAGREGFIHPYVIAGGVPETKIELLLRDFETPKLAEEADLLRSIAKQLTAEYPEARIDVAVHAQYRNMRDGMGKEPRAVPFALEAVRRAGMTPKEESIRGGTDGAQLTAKGLPTPNLSCGEHNAHSPLEFACLEEMHVLGVFGFGLLKVWAGK